MFTQLPKVSDPLPANVIVLATVVVAIPVPKFRLLLPPKVKFPPTVTALLFVNVTALPLVLSSIPAVRVSTLVEAPSAVALFTLSRPCVSVVAPV